MAQKKVTVYGTAKAKLVTGKVYTVSEKLAKTLVEKGSASYKPIKEEK